MNIIQGQYPSLQQMQETLKGNSSAPKYESNVSFEDILLGRANTEKELKFSKHASGRLEQRNIDLTDSQLLRLQQGAAKAQAKGINESLVIVDQLAFIVNVPNSTVITAMDQNEAQDNVFTNIDGAVII
jgi:flagellar operon protein